MNSKDLVRCKQSTIVQVCMVAEAIRKSVRMRRRHSLVADTLKGPRVDVHSLVLLGIGKLLGLLLAPVLGLDGLLALEVTTSLI